MEIAIAADPISFSFKFERDIAGSDSEAMVVPAWTPAAEVTETEVFGSGRVVVQTFARLEQTHLPSSLRIHGHVVLAHGKRIIGNDNDLLMGWNIHAMYDDDDDRRHFNHRVVVADAAVFRNYGACRELIHRTLADGGVTGDYDLAPANWVHSPRPPMDFAMEIGRLINSWGPGVRLFDIVIHIPSLVVCLVYSEPKGLIRACKETAAAGAPAAPGQVCAICLLELEPDDADTVSLPCFRAHTFHTPCILPWFHKESKCPICRRDLMDFFG